MSARQFATMAGMILLSFLMLGASFVALSYQYTIRDKQETLVRNANYIADFTSYTLNSDGSYAVYTANFQSYLNTAAQVTDSHILITTSDGVVAYATDGHQSLSGLAGRSITASIPKNSATRPTASASAAGLRDATRG